jgi:hypothetical protein
VTIRQNQTDGTKIAGPEPHIYFANITIPFKRPNHLMILHKSESNKKLIIYVPSSSKRSEYQTVGSCICSFPPFSETYLRAGGYAAADSPLINENQDGSLPDREVDVDFQNRSLVSVARLSAPVAADFPSSGSNHSRPCYMT